MKVWGTLALAILVSGCAGARKPEAQTSGNSIGKELVARLHVEQGYRPMPQGAQTPSAFLGMHPGAYVATGWTTCCRTWPGCDPSFGTYPRPGHGTGCGRGPCCCD